MRQLLERRWIAPRRLPIKKALNPGRRNDDQLGVTTNLDDRLLLRWQESQHRQRVMRSRLESSSLPPERFEGWALELIADALSPHSREGDRKPKLARPAVGVQADDR